jgi:hypothetical protein
MFFDIAMAYVIKKSPDFGTKIVNKYGSLVIPGVDVMITIFYDISQFSAGKNVVFHES